jgi:hypothetical protein
MPTFQSPAKADFADNSPSRERETSAGPVVATDPASVDADWNNGAKFKVRLDPEGAIKMRLTA